MDPSEKCVIYRFWSISWKVKNILLLQHFRELFGSDIWTSAEKKCEPIVIYNSFQKVPNTQNLNLTLAVKGWSFPGSFEVTLSFHPSLKAHVIVIHSSFHKNIRHAGWNPWLHMHYSSFAAVPHRKIWKAGQSGLLFKMSPFYAELWFLW